MPVITLPDGSQRSFDNPVTVAEVAANIGALAAQPARAQEFITVASTTSTEQSGLFDYLLPIFKAKSGIDVHVVAQGTGQALETGKRGEKAYALLRETLQALYRERSPVRHTDRLSTPLILFQGLLDKVVPPNQSQAMFDAVRAKGLPVAYVSFPNERHGFRALQSSQRALSAELYFYGRVFGFTPADDIEPVPIENLP